MIGGYGVFGYGSYIEKTITGLGAHSKLRLRGRFIKIDRWYAKRGQLLVDGGVAWESPTLNTGPNSQPTGGCGQVGHQVSEESFDFDVAVSHYADSVTLRFTSTIGTGEVNSFWGVNDVSIAPFVEVSPPAPPAPPGIWSNVLYERWPGATGWTSNQTLDGSAVTTCGGELGR